ncbi:hypothetical protein [Streptomyces syringium]|uniref:hypothetical protein n=1 Tax=Streptomyces syringium TaxID=76729 RepID=UPI00345717FC
METGDIAGWVGGAAGVIGLVYAHLANRQARQANDKGDESIRIAEEANAYARRSDDRSIERDDVRWEGDWAEPGQYTLVQKGEAAAHDVVATVCVDDEERTVRRSRVAHGEALVFTFPEAALTYASEQRQLRQARAEAERRRGIAAWGPQPDPVMLGFYSHSISERVDWATAHGTHKMHESNRNLATLGPHD